MIEGREHLCLATKPGEPIGIVRKEFRQDLQRDVAIELGVFRAVDLAHASGADGRNDFI